MATRSRTEGALAIDVQEQEIELVNPGTEVDLHAMAADEQFMNELVTIHVHPVTDENAPPYVILNCNGTNQPVARGVDQAIKRKFVEILARMKETKYTQVQNNPNDPSDISMRGRSGLCYPFEVVQDNNRRGRAWLTKIMAEAA